MAGKPAVQVTADEVKAIRVSLNLLQPVFADRLRTNTKTLQNWEQGLAKPNAQASVLIKTMARFPDMAQRLEAV